MRYGKQACRAFTIVVAVWWQIAFSGHAFAQEAVDGEGQGKNPKATEQSSIPLTKRPVSVAQSKISVQRLLEEVSKQVGVTLECDDTFKYSKLVVFMEDTPFGSLRSALANLLDAEWKTKEGDEADRVTVYRLAPTEHRKRLEQELREAEKEILSEQLRQTAMACAQGRVPDHMGDGMEGEEREKFRAEVKARGEVLSNVPDEVLQRVLKGEQVDLPATDLEGSFRKVVREFARRHAFLVSSGFEPNYVDKTVLSLTSSPYRLRTCPELPLRDVGFSFLMSGQHLSSYNLVVHPTAFREALLQRALQLGAAPQAEETTKTQKDTAPVPQSVSSWRGENATISQVLQTLFENAKLALLSDCYTDPPLPNIDFSQQQTMEEVLDAVASAFERTRGQVEGCILFRSKLWWLKDGMEVPDEWVAKWREKWKRQNRWSLEDLTEMARISDGQAFKLAALLPEASAVKVYYSLLHFFASLTPEQRQQGSSDAGLILAGIPEELKAALLNGPDRTNIQPFDQRLRDSLRAGTLKVTVNESVPRPQAVFQFTAPEGKGGTSVSVPLGHAERAL